MLKGPLQTQIASNSQSPFKNGKLDQSSLEGRNENSKMQNCNFQKNSDFVECQIVTMGASHELMEIALTDLPPSNLPLPPLTPTVRQIPLPSLRQELYVFYKDIGIVLDRALYSSIQCESIPTPTNTSFPLTKGWHNIVAAKHPLNPNHHTHLLMDQDDLLDLTEKEKERMFKQLVEIVAGELRNPSPEP
ncbi:hypothetical protein COLO4_15654 [Corchorus olitorius]|uniref:Uncharacterized protein n=1 Tax=Corchorus olitorius TaxID=93759 RepID=A0A1R3JLT9_9ROSI|nr:hypothetical protein COLO4_15654 [Corchorus olitorius]